MVFFVSPYKAGTLKELLVTQAAAKDKLLAASTANNTVRLYCIIMTAYKYFSTRAKAVNETWAPRCDTYFFMSESLLPGHSTHGLPLLSTSNVSSGYDHLTSKSVTAFLNIYENSFLNHDWLIKADDDTFIIVEHLRDFLRLKDPSEPVTYGYNFKLKVENGYHSGGASYVLSKEALKRLYFAYKSRHTQCKSDGGDEDVEIARCLRTADVYPGESLDNEGKEMFHPETFAYHFEGVDWLSEYSMNPVRTVSCFDFLKRTIIR
jgi:glycoprotein-N-acetylgalactosamine 3-beta-galactosyltransferase